MVSPFVSFLIKDYYMPILVQKARGIRQLTLSAVSDDGWAGNGELRTFCRGETAGGIEAVFLICSERVLVFFFQVCYF